MTSSARPSRRTITLTVYLVILAGVCVWTAVGGSILLLLVVVVAPALAVVRSRMALSASLALLLVVFAWTTLVVFIVSRYTRVPPILIVIGLAAVVGALCAIRLQRVGTTFTRSDTVDLAFTVTGALVWGAVIAVAAVIPGGSPISWAMTGDAANNVLFARTMLEQGGVSLGIGQNPVPLTTAFIGLFSLPGAVGGSTVGTEILALAEMWSFGIAAACVMSGALALSLIKRRSALGLLAVALASALPLGWTILSGPILLGFVNFHLTLALLTAGLVTLVHAGRAVLTSFVTVSLALAAVLALWAPLVGIPGVALVVLAIVHRKALLALRRGRLAIALLALAQPAGLFLALSVPSLIGQGDALQDSLGAVFDFKKIIVAVALVFAIVVGVLHMRATKTRDMGWVLIALVGGGGACLAALLWLRRNEANVWSYYQLKFLWFFLAMLLIVGVAAGLALAAVVDRRSVWSAVTIVAVLALVTGLDEYAKATVPTFSNDAQALKNPMARVVTGDFFSVGEDDRVFHRVVELMSADEKSILWESTDPDEDSIMFWVVQLSSSGVEDVDLRTFAYYHDGTSMEDLCTIRELIGPPVTVVTAKQDIADRVEAACAEFGPVRLEP